MAEDEEVWRLANKAKGQDTKLGRGSGGSRSPSLSAAAKARLRRIVAKRPEVMVKITGRTRGAQHLKAHLDYISRNAALEVETRDGRTIRDRAGMRALHDDWLQTNAIMAKGRNSPEAVQSVSIILSMSAGNPPDRVQEAARTWARETFAERHDWIMARHDDKDHPHVHITVRAVGEDGKRLTAGPAELQVWRERFARELRRHGIEAEATPRQARGVVQKADRLPINKIERSGKVARVRAYTAQPAASDTTPPRPVRKWENAIEQRQENIRQAYLGHSAALQASSDPADRQLAKDIERFANGLPIAMARRQALATELREITDARHERGAVSHPATAPEQPTQRRRR